jgi:cellulose 1,4-beta-cellobiosidase
MKKPQFEKNCAHFKKKKKKMFLRSNLLSLLYIYSTAQNSGSFESNYNPPISLQNCDSSGSCSNQNFQLTLDANWRWMHKVDSYEECLNNDNNWKCNSPEECSMQCVIEGIERADWKNVYGVQTIENGVELNLVTQGQYGKNVGSRMYLLNSNGQYELFKLKNREFSFDVDVSNLPCGLNGALYFVEMDADGGKSKSPFNKAGAQYGTGYCDAQCPRDLKWINGFANSKNTNN